MKLHEIIEIDRVQISRRAGSELPLFTLIVDRRSPFGNKFKITKHITRLRSVAKFETWWWRDEQKDLRAQLIKVVREKNIKHLACWCKLGEKCHADILIEYLNM